MLLLTFIFYGFIVIVALQVAYYVTFFVAFNNRTNTAKPKKNTSVSVIICAKNEAENLKKNISYILNQNHPNFEVVLINDNSSDTTLDVIKSIKLKHKNVTIVDVKPIEKFWGNKKYALTLGIKAAKNNILLFTDADCKPNSLNWITEMTNHFSTQKSIVLGYSGYEEKPSFLNKLIRYETLLTAVQYLSYAKLGNPYMGVGRNLAYRKSLFLNNSGFMNHLDIMSGDDDLFINEVANGKNTSVCFNSESFTVSDPKETLKDWILQKRRHISTSKFYKLKHKALLATFYFTQIGFWVFSAYLLSQLFMWQIVLGLILIRFSIYFTTIHSATKTFKEKGLIFLSPFLEIFLILTQLYIFIANQISKPKHWK
ncbi:glycosyltransferase [Winogradskyella sp. A3E31]|uniref:glycosyltransferase n=1 Tax=Winogradskyella sp. A3E31 TaxID=3349637 RepID=UPI00398B8B90